MDTALRSDDWRGKADSVSIIVCTSNHATSLRETLAALGRSRIRPERRVEVLVVDNGSTDDTAAVVRNAAAHNLDVRYWHEPVAGLSNARNAGLAQARGEFILFTDDDVVPADVWAERLVEPLENNRCDAVTGRIVLAPHLVRPWMTGRHTIYLAASPESVAANEPREFIGANMGFRRSVLSRVPGFDPELGAGALGFGEDTLYGLQLGQAGYRIEYLPDACVVHKFEESRLCRGNWLTSAARRGWTRAYIRHHWEHADLRYPLVKWLWLKARLNMRRIMHPPPPLASEGCPGWEMGYIHRMEECRRFIVERHHSRKYSHRGLVKFTG